METVWSYEHKALISELIQGMEFAKQLKMHMLPSAAPADSGDVLICGIVSSFEKALLILKWNGPVSGQCGVQRVPSATGIPESPLSVNDSPHSGNLEKGIQEQFLNRDRNIQNCWATKQVQRSDEDPTLFEITYRGTHTCTPAAPVSPPI